MSIFNLTSQILFISIFLHPCLPPWTNIGNTATRKSAVKWFETIWTFWKSLIISNQFEHFKIVVTFWTPPYSIIQLAHFDLVYKKNKNLLQILHNKCHQGGKIQFMIFSITTLTEHNFPLLLALRHRPVNLLKISKDKKSLRYTSSDLIRRVGVICYLPVVEVGEGVTFAEVGSLYLKCTILITTVIIINIIIIINNITSTST